MTIKAKAAKIEDLLAQLTPDSPPKKILSGSPQFAYAELVDTDKLNSGVWSSTRGSWEIASYSVNEVMMILSGRVRLTDAEGAVTELGAGDVYYVAKGWQGHWDVLEDVQKVYVIVP